MQEVEVAGRLAVHPLDAVDLHDLDIVLGGEVAQAVDGDLRMLLAY